MEITKGTKTSIWLGSLCSVLFLFSLVFRATIYSDMYLAPGEPYGISDMIEFLLGSLMIVLFAVSGAVAIYLLFRGHPQSKKSAVLLLILCVALLLSFPHLHTVAAKYGSKMPNKSLNQIGANNAPPG